MRRVLPFLLLIAALLPVVGCSPSRSAASANANRTREMSLRVPLSYGTGEVTAAALRLAVVAESECLMTDCSAKGVRLTFLNRSTRDVRLRFLPLQIVADGTTFDAPAPDVPQNQEYIPNGAFFSTLLRREFLPVFANARDVTIRLGQTQVTLSHSERQSLRDLIARMGPTSAGG